MKVGVVGLGYWGPNIVRNFLEHEEVDEVVACDANPSCLVAALRKFPRVSVETDWHRMLERPDVEAVAIATPVPTHYDLTKAALEAGKHVLVAKPFTTSVDEADELIMLAERHDRRLMVDHTYLFTPAVKKIKELVDSGTIGKLQYFDSVRINLGRFQHDVNVIWDLAPHDFSILYYLTGEWPVAVHATGMSHYGSAANIAYVTVVFAQAIAHFHVSWVSPIKVRAMNISGTKKLINFDELREGEQVRTYDSGVTVQRGDKGSDVNVQYHAGSMRAPRLERYEALSASTRHFLDCVNSGNTPLSDGRFGRDIVQLLDAADRSLRLGGTGIAVPRFDRTVAA